MVSVGGLRRKFRGFSRGLRRACVSATGISAPWTRNETFEGSASPYATNPSDLPARKTLALNVHRLLEESQKSGTISTCMPEQPRRDDKRSSPACVTYQRPCKQVRSPRPTERPYVDVRPCSEAKSGRESLPQMCSANRLLSRKARDIRFMHQSPVGQITRSRITL